MRPLPPSTRPSTPHTRENESAHPRAVVRRSHPDRPQVVLRTCPPGSVWVCFRGSRRAWPRSGPGRPGRATSSCSRSVSAYAIATSGSPFSSGPLGRRSPGPRAAATWHPPPVHRRTRPGCRGTVRPRQWQRADRAVHASARGTDALLVVSRTIPRDRVGRQPAAAVQRRPHSLADGDDAEAQRVLGQVAAERVRPDAGGPQQLRGAAGVRGHHHDVGAHLSSAPVRRSCRTAPTTRSPSSTQQPDGQRLRRAA